jgi:hypothetical protein
MALDYAMALLWIMLNIRLCTEKDSYVGEETSHALLSFQVSRKAQFAAGMIWENSI